MAPHSSTLAWKIPWTEEPGGLRSMGSLRVGHDWATSLSLFTFMHWRRKWQPIPVFLPGEFQGRGKPGGLTSMGSHRVVHDWSDLAAAAAGWQCFTSSMSRVYFLFQEPGHLFLGTSFLLWHCRDFLASRHTPQNGNKVSEGNSSTNRGLEPANNRVWWGNSYFWVIARALYSMKTLLTPRVWTFRYGPELEIPAPSSGFAFPETPFKTTTRV